MTSNQFYESDAGATSVEAFANSPTTNVCKFRISRIVIPYTFYSINSNNNTFKILEAANTLTITMTPGNYYSQLTFCAMLKTVLEAATLAAETYTCSANVDTGLLTISTTATNIGPQLLSYPKAAKVLGFQALNYTAIATSLSGTLPININSSYIKVGTNISTAISNRLNGSITRYYCIIPINVSAYGVIDYTPYSDYLDISGGSALANVRFDLYDQNGDTLGGATGLNGDKFVIALDVVYSK